jgi:ATP-binding cassette, subfamily F, member 3
MSILLQANNLSREYAGQKVFSGLTFAVAEKQKIGVIGRNGAGKSTLFRILTGVELADSGKIIVGSEAKIAYLKQEDDFITTPSPSLGKEGKPETGLEYLLRVSEEPEWTIKKLASKFQLGEEKLNMAAKSLSGGWRMRLKITAMLLQEPNLFLLDEPTNYLDLDTLLLLENYLKSYKGSFLIISHDRQFLKETCEETLEISPTGCYHYRGNIENYLVFKEQKLSTAIKANKGLARQQEHMQEFVDRFRYSATRAKQAQSLIRKIGKLENKRITIEHQAGITRINIPSTEKRANYIFNSSKLTIGYNNKTVVDNINLDCRAGEKLAVLGMNGQGKTTFLRTIAGFLAPQNGSFRWASKTRLAYHGPETIDAMPGREQVGEYLTRTASPEIKTEQVLKMAGDFLFRADDLKKSIGVLSGGEKSRLLLASLILSRPDIFILDEPTCHLDFETTEALGSALKKFNGTIFFASHDQTFCDLLSTALLEIKDGIAVRRLENYEEYVESREKELALKKLIEEKPSYAKASEDKPTNKEKYNKKRTAQKEAVALEKKLEKLNVQQLELLEYFLANPVSYDPDKAKELEEVKKMIKEKEDEWLAVNL